MDRPGIKTVPTVVKAQSLNHCITSKVEFSPQHLTPLDVLFISFCFLPEYKFQGSIRGRLLCSLLYLLYPVDAQQINSIDKR